jgi:ATP-dependent DNA helicase RecG
MKLSPSSTSKLSWSSSVSSLFRGGKSKVADQLFAAGYKSLEDLLWIAPLKIHLVPPIKSFEYFKEGEVFRGAGEIISHQTRPNFRARGKGRALLQNILIVVKDLNSKEIIHLRWFNAYGSINQKIKCHEKIIFTGQLQLYNGLFQIVNPEFMPYDPDFKPVAELKIQYPTISKISPPHLANLFNKIPAILWEQIPDSLPHDLREKRNLISLGEAFLVLHAKISIDEMSDELKAKALERLIYEEFFNEQIKILMRKDKIIGVQAPILKITEPGLKEIQDRFPFSFTPDQKIALETIRDDLATQKPMMRLIQGDVGCGKTAVALAATSIVINNGYQVALMCPTEALAFQHYETAQAILDQNIRILYLVGSLKASEKKKCHQLIESGEIDFVIGTHAIIQESVRFSKLGLSIIDEQHKFGVEQRLSLIKNNPGCHCLIMTATPIPRSLSLTQYGDLDITTIRSMPVGRKGHQTRIVNQQTMSKYLSFLKTRLSLGEQAYIVVPAIEESLIEDLQYLEKTIDDYKELFPDNTIVGLHGQMSSEEKTKTLSQFKAGLIDILVATSVIEVGIDVPNATVLSINNPERFGLSSLHQLRGRVGRGSKPGFFFLITHQRISEESLKRLKVIEKNTDGFIIAEEDLKIRGEGDLFGKEQSGDLTHKRFSNILLHQSQLLMACEDAKELWKTHHECLSPHIHRWSGDEKVFSTV